MKRYALIMAGGSGTRFWPKSSMQRPKQLLSLTGKKSQLQLTFDRLHGIIDKPHRWVIGTQLLAAATKKQIKGVTLLAEPEGRNTMAAICWGAWKAQQEAQGKKAGSENDALIIALPADAHISDLNSFKTSLLEAILVAENENRIVCLGTTPTYPATGYGYIQKATKLDTGGYQINRFVEKPDETLARELFTSGEYTWNAGIFVFKTSVFIEETRRLCPEFANFFDKNTRSEKKIKGGYKSLPKISIDVALMEKTSKGAVVPGKLGWNDVGSWRALEEVLPSNSQAGRVNAAAGHSTIDSHGNIVDVTDGKFVGLIGVHDLVIVETKNAILVCHKDKSEQVKDLVGIISKNSKFKKKLL